jgi:hypothetical protein
MGRARERETMKGKSVEHAVAIDIRPLAARSSPHHRTSPEDRHAVRRGCGGRGRRRRVSPHRQEEQRRLHGETAAAASPSAWRYSGVPYLPAASRYSGVPYLLDTQRRRPQLRRSVE